jgi:Flp pilus assembly protein TadD
MKYLIKNALFASLLLTVSACTNHAEEQWAKTLKVHDEIMVKMQQNGEIESKLNELLILAQKDSTSVLFAQSDTLKSAL